MKIPLQQFSENSVEMLHDELLRVFVFGLGRLFNIDHTELLEEFSWPRVEIHERVYNFAQHFFLAHNEHSKNEQCLFTRLLLVFSLLYLLLEKLVLSL